MMKKYSKYIKSLFVLMLLLIPIPFITINLNAENAKTNPNETIIINTEPIIVSDTIVTDTSGDGVVCENDRPFVTVQFSDDGNITSATIWFADHDLDNEQWFPLQESETDNKIWTGSFPYIKHSRSGILPDRTIRWWSEGWDDEGFMIDDWPSGVEFFTIHNRAPIVEITSPIGGENFTSGTLNITWNGEDLDLFDIVTFDVLYNRNNKGWILLAENITDTFYVWDISEVKYSKSVLIKVVVGDGFITTEAITPLAITIGTAGFSSFSILVLSFFALTSIPIYFKKQRRK